MFAGRARGFQSHALIKDWGSPSLSRSWRSSPNQSKGFKHSSLGNLGSFWHVGKRKHCVRVINGLESFCNIPEMREATGEVFANDGSGDSIIFRFSGTLLYANAGA